MRLPRCPDTFPDAPVIDEFGGRWKLPGFTRVRLFDVPWLSKTEPGVYLTMFNPLYFREMQGAWSIFDRCNGAAQQEQYKEWRGDDDARIAIDDGEAST